MSGPYQLHFPKSGGKAGTGHNLTSSLQVRDAGNCIVKQFRFTVADIDSRAKAVKKANEFINQRLEEEKK